MRALLSTDDKSGLVPFASQLHSLGWELVATGRTQLVLRAAGLPVTSVADLTGSPEMLGGRVKTLHPRIHAGILARRDNADDARDIADHDLPLFDMVVVNLYPFVELLQQAGLPAAELIEAIDIGGGGLLRAAAKNHEHVLVVSQPAQYGPTLAALGAGQGPSAEYRRELALAAFQLTAAYDAAIASWLGAGSAEQFPDRLTLPLQKAQSLRYGENPHQQGAFYRLDRSERITAVHCRRGTTQWTRDVLQQPARPASSVRRRQRLCRADGRHYQTHQPLRSGLSSGSGGSLPPCPRR